MYSTQSGLVFNTTWTVVIIPKMCHKHLENQRKIWVKGSLFYKCVRNVSKMHCQRRPLPIVSLKYVKNEFETFRWHNLQMFHRHIKCGDMGMCWTQSGFVFDTSFGFLKYHVKHFRNEAWCHWHVLKTSLRLGVLLRYLLVPKISKIDRTRAEIAF